MTLFTESQRGRLYMKRATVTGGETQAWRRQYQLFYDWTNKYAHKKMQKAVCQNIVCVFDLS